MAETKAKATPKAAEKKPDSFEMVEPDIEHDDRDRLMHGMRNSIDFRAKYGEKWRTIANALTFTATHHMRNQRKR
jgi:hypothetical protein